MVATAVALVGGGLTLGSMDRQSGDRTRAATAPEGPGAGAVEEQTAQDARPTSTRPDAHRSSPTPPAHAPGAVADVNARQAVVDACERATIPAAAATRPVSDTTAAGVPVQTGELLDAARLEGRAAALSHTRAHLARPYARHPDYRQEWLHDEKEPLTAVSPGGRPSDHAARTGSPGLMRV